MGQATSIPWTERSWNPLSGCDRVSPGCDHCYALALACRLKAMGSARYQRDGDPRTSGPGFGLTLHRDLLDQPRGWRRPSLVFVNSMSDLFHDRVPLGFIQAVFRTMAETPRHSYQVLTKRSARLLRLAGNLPWPPNVWMGVTVESPAYVVRAERLTRVPAAVRFVSAEPLLGPVDLGGVLRPAEGGAGAIGWVIVGGESGPGARPMRLEWARDLLAQCRDAGVACFVKQLGTAWAGRGKGEAMAAWPEGLRVREMPAGAGGGAAHAGR